MADTVSQTVLFPDLFDKPLVATFQQLRAPMAAPSLKAAERQYGLIDGFAECLVDDRQPGKVRPTLADLLGQRIFGIACGHPVDGDRLADSQATAGGTRSRATRLPRNRRSRGLKTTWGAKSSMPWGRSWR